MTASTASRTLDQRHRLLTTTSLDFSSVWARRYASWLILTVSTTGTPSACNSTITCSNIARKYWQRVSIQFLFYFFFLIEFIKNKQNIHSIFRRQTGLPPSGLVNAERQHGQISRAQRLHANVQQSLGERLELGRELIRGPGASCSPDDNSAAAADDSQRRQQSQQQPLARGGAGNANVQTIELQIQEFDKATIFRREGEIVAAAHHAGEVARCADLRAARRRLVLRATDCRSIAAEAPPKPRTWHWPGHDTSSSHHIRKLQPIRTFSLVSPKSPS